LAIFQFLRGFWSL